MTDEKRPGWRGESELQYIENPVVRVEGAQSPDEAATAIIAGKNAPNVLSFDPSDDAYDAQWCRMVRGVGFVTDKIDPATGEPIIDWLDDVIAFDIPRGVVETLIRAANGDPEFTPHGAGTLDERLRYRRRAITGHVTVSYGVPIEPPKR